MPEHLCEFPSIREEQRGVLQDFNLAALAVTMAAYLAGGLVTRPMGPWVPAVALAVVLPGLAGAAVYRRLSERDFRRAVLLLLTASGAAMLFAAGPRPAA